nr:MAG TPA: hypothetical protein [Caudoviricetes sp.]
MTLCECFQGLNPITLRTYRSHEVFLLMKRLSKRNRRKNKIQSTGTKVIRRPAGDNWF